MTSAYGTAPRDPASQDRGSHDPVMVGEVLAYLGDREEVLDCTLGAGGHAEALLDAGVGRVVGIDRDPEAIELATARLARFGPRFTTLRTRFSALPIDPPVDGVLLDLGVSSMQLDRAERGFSYREPGPLDMRMGPDATTAMDLVNELPESELANVLFEFGEERRSRRVAAAINRARGRSRITTTEELAAIVAGALGSRPGGPHPARRTFQALRIAANDELDELRTALPRATEALRPGGRLVVIAYHSLEDRIAKRFLIGEERLRILTKKPLVPSEDEVRRNPRARSAKLRAAERLVEAA
ncbi:MAG: 16S rRNA (cytosine(1402)-N(4))-methyltransferase RsmH [Actinomycetota bacterium]